MVKLNAAGLKKQVAEMPKGKTLVEVFSEEAKGASTASPANPANAAPAITEIYDPSTGKTIDAGNIDGMADLYTRMMNYAREAETVAKTCRVAIIAKAAGAEKTEYVRGRDVLVKVEWPSATWDDTKLLEAWVRFPDERGACLRIGKIKVDKREFNKLLKTTGNEKFEFFKAAVKAAEKESTAMPTISIGPVQKE